MIAKDCVMQNEFVCPHCKSVNFVLLGVQKQKGLFKDHELWKCRSCHGTFARETIEVRRSAENESFNKNASSYYCRVLFAR
jgi:transposase-like protein